jgi:hypothetical protein
MSENITADAAKTEAEGFVVIEKSDTYDVVELLQKTCQKLSLPKPVYEEKVNISGTMVSGYTVQLENWIKPVVFDVEKGTVSFDNYSDFTHDHPEVKAGRKRLGENGKWGHLEKLDQFRNEYANQLNHELVETHMQTASMLGHYAAIVEETEDRIVLEIEV